ncbi:transmembrane protein [Ceratobasidium sp. AG-Ba]|nr:transmembrane protein [Ceratobasidium sp. AG-Ba]QRW11052.1 transmembrane protein [Ceratobasidium sp. AG-Ba]
MILDVEQSPKSPRSPVLSPGSPNQPLFFQQSRSHVSYSTFTGTGSQSHSYGPSAPASDITSLLAQDHGSPADDGELPPTYDQVQKESALSRGRRKFWSRAAFVVLTLFLVSLTWVSYHTRKHHTSKSPASQPIPQSSSSPAPSATTSGGSTPMPPKPSSPASIPPNDRDNLPFVLPISGRVDLCRHWAYSLDSQIDYRSMSFEKHSINQLIYTVPNRDPIHIETAAICPDRNGKSELCRRYEEGKDVIAGKLQVVGGDVDKPRIEVSYQPGSGIGAEDVSVCLLQRSATGKLGSDVGESRRWVLGVYIRESPTSPGHNNVFATLDINMILPTSSQHDLSTDLPYFSQTIGPGPDSGDASVSFNSLRLAGGFGPTVVQNIEATTIQATSSNEYVVVGQSRISRLLDLRSDVGLVGCNVTLVHRTDHQPITTNLQSEAGTISGVFDVEYSTDSHSPRFDFTAHSRLARAVLWINDQQGTKLLRSHVVPPVLPALRVNLTSLYSTTLLMVPATFYGSFDLSSRYSSATTNDYAKDLMGRTVQWSERLGGRSRGLVKWAGQGRDEAGSVIVASQLAAARVLFLGLHNDTIAEWPAEGDKTGIRQ